MNAPFVDVNADDEVRRLTIKYAGGVRPSEVVVIQPGITAGELLRQLGLDTGYQVSKGGVDTVFGLDEPLWPRVADGDLVFITSLVDAGC